MLRRSRRRPLRTRLSVVVTALCACAMAATACAWFGSGGDPAAIVIVEVAGLLVVATATTAVVRRELRPLEHAAATADSIAAGDLSHRVTEATTAPATEVGRLAVALNRMLDQIQAALTAREASEERMRQFVADASHELRTPLQSLRGYAELYQHGALPDTAAVDTAVGRMASEIQRMTRLVESLLMLARFDEEDEAELELVDLSRVVAESCQDAAAVEPDRPRSVRIQEGVFVLGDEAQLRSLMANLLGNIRMHTAPDVPCGIELSGTRDTVLLSVEDRGPGIPPESQGHVFDRFYRADKGRSRAVGGTGLGLSIVAAVAELHHAGVRLDSVPGHGTLIEIAFPPGR
ncbi:sensor histidine kinase [Streptomyces anulatus]|uniref:sensor histidine kinase n=1 Tax=Streptomyces anulatus TaxID=1892 RepID=UPI0020B814C1|nr:HAMP domain-containing sensor histidine kinase [Streptomyces anulatus]